MINEAKEPTSYVVETRYWKCLNKQHAHKTQTIAKRCIQIHLATQQRILERKKAQEQKWAVKRKTRNDGYRLMRILIELNEAKAQLKKDDNLGAYAVKIEEIIEGLKPFTKSGISHDQT